MVPHNPSSRPPAGESLQGKAAAVLPLLDRMYPQARCSLNFENPLELLVATILSAQCTDERVNQVTPGLFRKYPTAGAYAQVPIEELEADIKSTGFYRNKAKNIRSCCAILAERFEGAVPRERWTLFSHQMIQHGRNLCRARKPRTEACPLRPHCDFGSGRST